MRRRSLEHRLFLEADAATGSTGDRNDEMSKMLGFLIDLFWQGKVFIYLSIIYVSFFCWRTVIFANKHVHSTDTCTRTLHVRPYMTHQIIMHRNTQLHNFKNISSQHLFYPASLLVPFLSTGGEVIGQLEKNGHFRVFTAHLLSNAGASRYI